MNTQEFVSMLFEIEVNSHIAHLQVEGDGSFAIHMALNDVYQNIVGLRDRFIESWQGKYGIIKGYKSFNIIEGIDVKLYLGSKYKLIDEYQKLIPEADSHLKQIVDDIKELIISAIYKLRFLK